jgi:hypothetical protein
VIRIVGRYIGVFTRHTVRVRTYDGKPTDENEIGVKLAALNTKDSARHKETLFSGRKVWGKEINIIVLAESRAVREWELGYIGNRNKILRLTRLSDPGQEFY